LRERTHRAGKRIEVDLSLGKQIEEGGQIAPFGPTDVPDRVVDAMLSYSGS
jgi:hypothetical protein